MERWVAPIGKVGGTDRKGGWHRLNTASIEHRRYRGFGANRKKEDSGRFLRIAAVIEAKDRSASLGEISHIDK